MNLEELIIYRPQSQSAMQRWTSTTLTSLAWAMLFYGFFPIVGFFVGRQLLPSLPFEYNVTSMNAWGSLVPLLPWWVLSVVVMIATLYLWATVQFIRFRHSRRSGNTKLVSTAEMAAHCEHPEESVEEWGEARRAVAHYDDNAKMVGVSTALTEPFREIPREDEPPAPSGPLAEPALPDVCTKERAQVFEQQAAELRTSLVDYWGRIETIEALMRDIAENRKLRNNNRDVVLYAQLKKDRAGMLLRIKTSRTDLARTRFLLEVCQERSSDLAALNGKVSTDAASPAPSASPPKPDYAGEFVDGVIL
jgi:poly-beta-1,6-N-acetyl-D-glucosamine biosynthesis protein PgaD